MNGHEQSGDGLCANWKDLAHLMSGLVKAERKDAIEECLRVVRAHLGASSKRAGVERVLEEMARRV